MLLSLAFVSNCKHEGVKINGINHYNFSLNSCVDGISSFLSRYRWYDVDFSMADPLRFGLNLGCDFAQKSCYSLGYVFMYTCKICLSILYILQKMSSLSVLYVLKYID